ncbi:helix-turn-helix domain-containing protein [Solihabitans fulvus]|uniref:Helix-turn-helix domain-containing protein n=1 Tax=Solihabitans fulvus TaxID=1892852 RepID=A0A5B2WVR8_9PSEU|nr:helix-turn-helix transcriptional regulator [Solihabitans fulvus]KAA2254960.1 helix-turn-helix domain-containing protein [Solihabitans fulvus]
MAKQQASVSTRHIGLELERHRHAAGMNLEQVGKKLGLSAATMSRTENGKRAPSSEEVASILTVLGVTGSERERLIEQARSDHSSGLLTTDLNAQSRTYQGLERTATSITNFELVLVPGLAQTVDYAHAVISTLQFHESDSEIEARVARRISRQAIFTRKQLPELNFIVTEVGLRLPIGGPRVMTSQVRHLVDLSERPQINIRIVPAGVAAHPGLTGSFALMSFSDSVIVCVESRTCGMFLDDPRQVEFHKLTAEKLLEIALDEQESRRLMLSIARDHDRE